jgi:hypothetical protein
MMIHTKSVDFVVISRIMVHLFVHLLYFIKMTELRMCLTMGRG